MARTSIGRIVAITGNGGLEIFARRRRRRREIECDAKIIGVDIEDLRTCGRAETVVGQTVAVIEVFIAVRRKKVLAAFSLKIVQSDDIERVVAWIIRFRRISRRRLATLEQTVTMARQAMDGIEVVQHFVTYQSIDIIDVQRMSTWRNFLPVRSEEGHTLQHEGSHSEQNTENEPHGEIFSQANNARPCGGVRLKQFFVGG